ncbi:MAG: glycosyltransferase family 4 protein [Rhodospirillales bacterium]|jgi:glycosyltransferase involved in cell wall biosynthesis
MRDRLAAMRIIFMNNYDALRHERLWREAPDSYPSHHLWGVPHLRAIGHDVEILPYPDDDTRRWYGGHIGLFGDPVQQRAVLARRSRTDLVYSGHQNSALGLAFLRRLGLLRIPVIGVVHRSYRPSARSRAFVKAMLEGYDRPLMFSDLIRRDLNRSFGVPMERMPLLDWGMDMRTAPWKPAPPTLPRDAFMLSVGKTYRDFPTMIEGHRRTGMPLKGIGWSSVEDTRGAPRPPHVEVVERAVQWSDLAPLYRSCFAVAIPVDPERATGFANTCGLTSLHDAMAFGRPVIMTRTIGQAIDVERERIGIHVAPGDADGWTRAIETLRSDPALAAEMGRRARHLAETRFNIDRYGRMLANVVDDVALRDPIRRPKARTAASRP